MIKRRMIMHALLLLIVLLAMVSASLAYFSNTGSKNQDLLIGDVDVEAVLYYEKSGVGCTDNVCPIQEVVVDEALNITKDGVYYINVTDPNAIEFIENFRIKFIVRSNVDTYIRIQLIEYLTLITTNLEGIRTEIPITTEATEFYFDDQVWQRNTLNDLDEYYYYTEPVQRIDAFEGTEVTFIGSFFPGANYTPRAGNYIIQLALKVEAVQALNGPQMRWGLSNPPWGGNW